MTRLKFPTLILASAFAITQSGQNCAQTPQPASPQLTPAQQAAQSAKAAEQAAKEAQDAASAAQAAAKAEEAKTAADDASKAAAAAKAAKDPREAAMDAEQAARYAQEAVAAAAAAQNLVSQATNPSAGCITESEPRVGAVKNRWPPQWRPQAGEDYFKLEYDVSSHQMRWFDYKHQGSPAGIDVPNGSVLPVVYSREKVLVHVDCLHPTDTVSITTNDIALPEQGADIRGVTPPSSTAAALTPTLDSLGSASAAGTALGTPGFSFGAPPTLPTGTTSLFTPGTSKDGTTYTDAVINIAPEALAIETNALVNQVMDAINSYNELETGKRSDFKTNNLPARGTGAVLLNACSLQDDEDLPGSICGLQVATKKLLTKLSPPTPADNTLSAFNDDLAQTQTLVSQLNGLAAGMNQAALPARAIAIRQNMEAIVSLLGEVSSTFAEDLNYGKNLLQWVDSKQTIKTAATCQQLYEKISAGDAIDAQGPPPAGQTQPIMVKSNPPDTPICHAMEQYTLGQFLQSYHDALDKIKGNTAEQLSNTAVPHSPAARIAMAVIYPSGPLPHFRKVPADLLTVNLRPVQSHSRSSLPPTENNLEDITHPLRAVEVSLEESNSPDFGSTLSGLGAVPNSSPDNSTAYPILTAPICPSPSTAATCTNPNWVVDTGPFQNSVEQLFLELLKMREQVGDLDQQVGSVFAQMNDRYVGSWVDETDALPPLTSNTIVRVGINVQRNYTPFTLTGGATVGTAAASSSSQPAASVSPGGGQQGGGQAGGQQSGGGKGSQSAGQSSSSQSASASASGATSTSGSNDFTVIMEVHRFANFNLVGGVMAIHAKNYSFATVPEYASFTPGTGVASVSGSTTSYIYSAYVTCPPNSMATSTTSGAVLINSSTTSSSLTPSPSPYYCINQTQTASLQPAGMVGVAWFPWHRDYFPRDRGDKFQGRNWIPSFMAASAVTQLGSVFFGPNLEPFNGIDLFGGWATANVTSLAKGTSLNQVLLPVGSSGAAPTLNTATHVKGGISFGVGFDISTFLQLFGKAQGPSLP